MSWMGIPGASCGDGRDDIGIFKEGVDIELPREELLMSDIVLPIDWTSSLFLLIFLNLVDCDPLGLSDISSMSTPDRASLDTEWFGVDG